MSINEMNAHEKEMMQKKNLTGIKVLLNQKKPRIL